MAKSLGKYTQEMKEQFLENLRAHKGCVSKALGDIPYTTMRFWYDNEDWFHDEYEKIVESVERLQFDVVESSLMKQIQEGNIRAIIYWLSTKGRRYGYGSATEVTINNTIAKAENVRPIINFIEEQHQPEEEK